MFARELALKIGGRLLGDDVVCERLAVPQRASCNDVTIVVWPYDYSIIKNSHASVVICDTNCAVDCLFDSGKVLIVIDDVISAFFALRTLVSFGAFKSPLEAFIHETAVIEPFVHIEPGAIIGAGCHIKAGTVIGAQCRLGNGVQIGAHSVIGADGFAPFGQEKTELLPSVGYVHIEDSVRLGAHCTVDRGVVGETRIKQGTLIDNMVHIGHDAVVGKNVVIAAQTALAGFVEIGDSATLGGQVGVVPHAVIGEGARISAKSLVRKVVGAYEIWSGNPSMPHAMYLKEYARAKRRYRESNEKYH